jgi:ferredoxin
MPSAAGHGAIVMKARPRFLPREALRSLFEALAAGGYRCVGPQVRDGAMVYADLPDASALPVGFGARQAPGEYRLEERGDQRCFAWANGPQALKPLLFRPQEPLWQARRGADGQIRFESAPAPRERRAVIGVRACDLAALALHDKHFLHKERDPWYAARRADLLLIAVDCSHPADTCFCVSTGDGPAVEGETDLALTELDRGFLVRAYTAEGAALRDALPLREATPEELDEAEAQIAQARQSQTRRIPDRNLRDALFANLDHPRWAEVSERCLSCGNCVAVCPTCFCHTERDLGALDGTASTHLRRWDSCFSAEHSYLHGRLLRPDTRTRYRQWLTHKLGGWHDQYGRSGCVGCGRCITWCPVGIDLTEEAAAVCAPSGEGQVP